MTTDHHDQPAFRNGLISKAVNKRRNSDELPAFASQFIPVLPPTSAESYPAQSTTWLSSFWAEAVTYLVNFAAALWQAVRRRKLADFLDVRIALILLWILALWLGEEGTFNRSIKGCSWDRWETWPSGATPHRVILIADPQLVDPHTYPGRLWPLSTLTIRYTDLYIRKSFQKLSKGLLPNTVLFLGDLFDGGREWTNDPTSGLGPKETKSVEEEWRKYGQGYWLEEYRRFGRIFFDTWLRIQSEYPAHPHGRNLIASLPGNHDLGLGNGIRLPARARFNVYFGEGSRIDVLGNHSFVSIDTVSLSAKGQIDPLAGTQGVVDEEHSRAVWEPVDEFLHTANAVKARAIEQALRTQNGLPEYEPQESTILELDDPRSHTIPTQPSSNATAFPSILLSHVPLYRAPGTPCGPLREKYPPSKSTQDGEPLSKDEPNAIPYVAGKQYQNVLTPEVTNEIVEFVSDISHAFSGDDHDYCEVLHREHTSKGGGIREITVKSISWAMGIRHPGFQMVSLWNPVDAYGKRISAEGADETVQTHLCIMPDQLSIFIRYAWLLILTVVVLVVIPPRATRESTRRSGKSSQSILPVTQNGTDLDYGRKGTHSSSSSSGQAALNGGLSTRAAATRQSRAPSPGYGIPPSQSSSLTPAKEEKSAWNDIDLNGSSTDRGRRASLGVRLTRVRRHMAQVALVVGAWYFYLLWTS